MYQYFEETITEGEESHTKIKKGWFEEIQHLSNNDEQSNPTTFPFQMELFA